MSLVKGKVIVGHSSRSIASMRWEFWRERCYQLMGMEIKERSKLDKVAVSLRKVMGLQHERKWPMLNGKGCEECYVSEWKIGRCICLEGRKVYSEVWVRNGRWLRVWWDYRRCWRSEGTSFIGSLWLGERFKSVVWDEEDVVFGDGVRIGGGLMEPELEWLKTNIIFSLQPNWRFDKFGWQKPLVLTVWDVCHIQLYTNY